MDADELQCQLEQTQARLREAETHVAKLREAHTVSAVEFTKTRDRILRDQAMELERARLAMTTSLFEVADNLDRVVTTHGGGSAEGGLLEGVALVRDQFFAELGKLGLERFGERGEAFDPAQHEAVGVIDVPEEHLADRVANVLAPGYRSGDQVLRAATVQVGRHTTPQPGVDEAAEARPSPKE